jgi:tetratricopeptide (TPR) repeat protein
VSTASRAQEASGRLTGVVRGADGEPLEGATVRLWAAGSEASAIETTTDRKGRWARVGLLPGRWEIRIQASGHIDGEGWVEVPARGVVPPVEVELRSLDEESAAFYEGGSGTIVRWLERANSMLSQGRTFEARDEYRRALAVLPLEDRPEVLRAVARTWYLDGETQNALDALEEALRIAPDDAESRLLFRGLLEQQGRGGETDRRLAEIVAAGPPPEPRLAASPGPPAAPAGPPAAEPVAHRTGQQRLAFSEKSPLAEPPVYAERFGLEDALAQMAPDEVPTRSLEGESFEVYVPESYRAGEPYGLLVWVSPTPFGGFRRPDYPRILTERKLIWVGANGAGNARNTWERASLALDAAFNMARLYTIDPARVYVAGYSGGGRLSSSLALVYPDLFAGGMFFFGCNWFETMPVPDKPGSYWPQKFPRPPDLARVERDSRMVFVTGERDFNRQQTRATWRRAEELGFERIAYLEIPGATHYFGIPGEWLERSLDALGE